MIGRLRAASGVSDDVIESASIRFRGPRPADASVSTSPDAHLNLFSRWLVQSRDGLDRVPAADDPRVIEVFNALRPALESGP